MKNDYRSFRNCSPPPGFKIDKTKKVFRYAGRIQALLVTPDDEKKFLEAVFKNRTNQKAMKIARELKLKTV
jgi:hypothetical protein